MKNGDTIAISQFANLVYDAQSDPTNPGWVLEYEMRSGDMFGQEIISADQLDEVVQEALAFIEREKDSLVRTK